MVSEILVYDKKIQEKIDNGELNQISIARYTDLVPIQNPKYQAINYQLQRKTEVYVNGELQETLSEVETIKCAVLPLGAKELRTLPEGVLQKIKLLLQMVL